MKRRSLLLTMLLSVALLLAVIPMTVLAEEPLSPTALEIANNLNCPVCEGQSIRDSNSQLARDMRRIVQEQLDEGYTEDEVYDYFIDRYGVGILREPPKSGFFMTLWWAPVIGIVVGALVLGTFITQRRKSASTGSASSKAAGTEVPDDDLNEYEQRVLRDLENDDAYSGGRW